MRRIYNGQTGGSILPAHGYYDTDLFLGPILFYRLVAPLLQLGVVGRYLEWGAWFPSHLPLEQTGQIQILWQYLGYRTSTGCH
jgi:hypothetical protein